MGSRRFTREEATEAAKLAQQLVDANARRNPARAEATLREDAAMFTLKLRLDHLYKNAAGTSGADVEATASAES